MIINTDGITDEQRATPKFRAAYQEIVAQLNVPGFISVLCAHEAAHMVYFTLAGAKNFAPHPTRIFYDPEIDDYAGDLAGVQLLDMPVWTPGKFSEWFDLVARAHAAGGVVARKLMPSTDGGDQDDRSRFKKMCEDFNKDPNISIDFEKAWKQAQDSVNLDLEIPEFMAAILEQSYTLRPQLGF